MSAGLKERGNLAFRRGQYEEALELYYEAIALVASTEVLADIDLLTTLRSNAAECALKLGQWHAAIELSEAALLTSPGHTKSAARKRRAELALTLQDSLPAGSGTDSEVKRAVNTLSQLLLPDLFDQKTRILSLNNGDPMENDRNVHLMLAMTPSLYDAMHQTILEEIEKAKAWPEDGPLYGPLFYTPHMVNHLLSLTLRGKELGNPPNPTIKFYDPKRSLRFIQTGVSLSSTECCGI